MMESDPSMLAIALLVAGMALLLAAASWWRSRQQAMTGNRIELLTSRYLGSKKVLTLVEVEGERLLLGLSGGSIRLLARFRHRTGPARERGDLRIGQVAVVDDAEVSVGAEGS